MVNFPWSNLNWNFSNLLNLKCINVFKLYLLSSQKWKRSVKWIESRFLAPLTVFPMRELHCCSGKMGVGAHTKAIESKMYRRASERSRHVCVQQKVCVLLGVRHYSIINVTFKDILEPNVTSNSKLYQAVQLSNDSYIWMKMKYLNKTLKSIWNELYVLCPECCNYYDTYMQLPVYCAHIGKSQSQQGPKS